VAVPVMRVFRRSKSARPSGLRATSSPSSTRSPRSAMQHIPQQRGPLLAVPGPQPHLQVLDLSEATPAVKLGLVHPAVPRRRARGRAEEHRLVRDGHAHHSLRTRFRWTGRDCRGQFPASVRILLFERVGAFPQSALHQVAIDHLCLSKSDDYCIGCWVIQCHTSHRGMPPLWWPAEELVPVVGCTAVSLRPGRERGQCGLAVVNGLGNGVAAQTGAPMRIRS
jgi:hypothetical protein